jgi:putative component of toxin-antitoxin plasmid stabilization module
MRILLPYHDLWELANTTIEPMTMNRLPRLFMVDTGNWVKIRLVAGSVVHLSVHLENGQRVYFTTESAPTVVDQPANTT